jgi:uncharacterized membrane protein
MKQWLNVSYRLGPLRFFAIVAATFGMAFLLITPPFQGADEVAHYFRAYQVSEGHLVSSKASNGAVGGFLPSDIGKVMDITDNPSVQSYPNLKYNEHLTKAALEVPRSQRDTFYSFPASIAYPPTAYPGPAIGIITSRILHLPTMVSLYAARLGNLATWILLIGAAIYFLPFRKWALVAVGLLPMGLFQAATLNGDAITVGTLALLMSLTLHYRQEAIQVTRRMGAALLALASVMVLSKQIMFIFLPLALLFKKENFSTLWKSRAFKIAMIVVPLVVFAGWTLALHGLPANGDQGNHQNPSAQLHFILFNPHSYINVLWNTYFYTWGDYITKSFIGVFGWADTPLSAGIIVIGYIGLFLLLVGSTDKKPTFQLTRRAKQLLWATVFLYWLALSTALYVYYSPVAFKIIIGLQGRYYLPFAVLAIPLIQSRKIIIDKLFYSRLAVLFPIGLLLASTITLYVRYFINNV